MNIVERTRMSVNYVPSKKPTGRAEAANIGDGS